MNFKDIYGKKTLLFDGAMGTMLQAKKLIVTGCTDLLSFTSPDAITEIHSEYIQAGSDIVTTNTFGANPIKLGSYGLADKVRDINISAVQAARAASPDVYIAGDLGPTGAILAPYGTLAPLEAYNAYCAQASALAEGGADLFIIETMSDIREARLAYLAARQSSTLPVLVSMTYEKGRTLMGNPPSVIAALMSGMHADGIGANCSGGPEEISAIIDQYAKTSSIPLFAQPNAGIPVVTDGVVSFPLNNAAFSEAMAGLAQKCVCIGGCCGTTPEHIRALQQYVHPLTSDLVTKEPVFVNVRKVFPLDVTACTAELNLSSANLTDEILDSDADCIILNLDCTIDVLAEKMQELQSIYAKPYIFRSDSYELLDAALFNYCGIAGIMTANKAAGEALGSKYGAIVL